MRVKWTWLGFLVLSVVASGCAARGLPAYSLARYARANSGEQVRLVGAGSGGYARETAPSIPGGTEAEALAIPLVEAAGRISLHDLYSLTFTVGPGMLSAEGQLRFGDAATSIGIVHGVGGGLTSFGNDPTFQLNLMAGVFAQIGIDQQNYILIGARYVFDDLYGGMTSPGDERGNHWIGGGFGWLGQLFSLFGIGLEVHGGVIARVDGGPTAWFILPTATLNAAF